VLNTYDMLEASDSTESCVTCFVSFCEGLNSDHKQFDAFRKLAIGVLER
jgi:hypothetical protein